MPPPADSAFVFIHINEMRDFLRGLSPRFQEMHLKGGSLATRERLFGVALVTGPRITVRPCRPLWQQAPLTFR